MKKPLNFKYGKLLLDLILLVFLALMYHKKAISMEFHEVGGLVLCGLFLMHKVLNWRWIRTVTVGICRRKAKINLRWAVDVLLLLSITAVLVTGLLIAKKLPTAIANARWLKPWHYFSAALALVLSGIHLGLHAELLKSALWHKLLPSGRARTVAGALLLCIVFCFGSYALVRTGFLSWLSQPVTSFSASMEDGHAPAAEDSGHIEGEQPGRGNRDGKGNGGGKGLGLGKGKTDEGSHEVSLTSALQTVISYTSILLWSAIVTAVLEISIRKKKLAHPCSE
ncbi:MAG: DUF4405 domain-containing protein [Faecousia sp.]